MKLKPLIKTHWLASQNPMTVPLAGLRRVVFAPQTPFLNVGFTPLDGVPLPPLSDLRSLIPDDDEVLEVRTRSHSLSRDLFWTLFSGHAMSSLRAPPAALLQVAQSLEFHFDDGRMLSLIGIFRQPDLPLFLNPKFLVQDRSCNWSRALARDHERFAQVLKFPAAQKISEDLSKAWFVVLEILAWALRRKHHSHDLEVIWSPHPDGQRLGYPLHEIEFLPARPLAVTVMSEPKFPGASRMTVWQGIEGLPAVGVLQLHSVGFLSELESQWTATLSASAEERATIEARAKPLEWQPRFVTHEADPKQITRQLARLEQSVGEEPILFVGHRKISGPEFKPQLRIRQQEGTLQAAVSFELGSMDLTLEGFPAPLRRALSPFWGGLEYYFGIDRKEVASGQARYRAADMLVLRHQGITLFCLLELINWHLKRPLSSGQSIEFIDDPELPEADRRFEQILEYLKAAIPGLLGKSGTSFQEMLSSEVRDLFVDFVEKTDQALRADRFLVFHGGQIGEAQGVQAQTLPLLRFLLLHLIEATQSRLLTRTQAPVGDRLKEGLEVWTNPSVRPTPVEPRPLWVDIGLYNKYLITLLFDLTDHGVKVELNGQPFLNESNPFEFVFEVGDAEQKDDANWFDLHPQIFFNGTRVNSEEVQLNFTPNQIGFIEFRGQIYRIEKKQMPTLKSLNRFWSRVRGQQPVVKHNSFGEKVYRLEKSQALELLMLQSQGIDIEVKGEWKRVFDYFANGLGVDKIQLPQAMQDSLLPHQREGAQWLHDLYELRLGAILADEMGLGKTFQVLSFLTSLQNRGKLGKSLIVVPTSLVYNWVDEKKKFAANLPLKVFHSSDQDEARAWLKSDEPVVLIATYGLINENLDFFESQNWNVLAFDEAQNLKNITSVRSVSARKLRARFKVCLTGTPMENHYLEFFALCDLVVPGSLGGIDSFRREYNNHAVRAESLRELRLRAKPLLLRRTKAQVRLALPIKTVQKVILPFAVKQREIYKKMAMTFSRQVEELILEQGERKAQIAMFSALMRLRQICSDPAAIPGVVYNEQPVKVEHFLAALQEHLENSESVIVFTQFLSTLGRIEGELRKRNVPTFTLQGKIRAGERLRLISAFQESAEPGVMLMTLKTGGVGLNLTKASVVYHLEPWWNPAVENQATDRAHRMGQKKDVKVYNLLIEGSLEERIADLKLKKQGAFDRLFGVDEQVEETSFEGASMLTRDDFIFLLK